MISDIILQIPIILFALTIHEVSHGWVAYKLGDSTAHDMNRLTLNPIAHIDLFGTIILPAILILTHSPVIGWAKPVPVDSRYFKNPKKGMMLTSAAGPLSNFAMAFVSYAIFQIFNKFNFVLNINGINTFAGMTLKFFLYCVIINLILGIFNLIPIPPFDGGRVMVCLLPNKLAYTYSKIEPYGIIIIFILFYFNILQEYIEKIFRFIMATLFIN
jgi:Zn-dependent protease